MSGPHRQLGVPNHSYREAGTVGRWGDTHPIAILPPYALNPPEHSLHLLGRHAYNILAIPTEFL